jgi:glycine/D-amino acid oxidase-like deaminating enzyme
MRSPEAYVKADARCDEKAVPRYRRPRLCFEPDLLGTLHAHIFAEFQNLTDFFLGGGCKKYADTIDEDWIIDYHPDHPRLLLATGGSGHGFKVGATNNPGWRR